MLGCMCLFQANLFKLIFFLPNIIVGMYIVLLKKMFF